MEYANSLTVMVHAYKISTRGLKRNSENGSFRPETARTFSPLTACVEYCVPCSRASFKEGKARHTIGRSEIQQGTGARFQF